VKDCDVDLPAHAKLLHQRHINPRMHVSHRVYGRMSVNVGECGVEEFEESKAYRLSGCFA